MGCFSLRVQYFLDHLVVYNGDYKKVASFMGITVSTAKCYKNKLFKYYNASTMAEMLIKALKEGDVIGYQLIEDEPYSSTV